MVKKEIQVMLEEGLEENPMAQLVQLANRFQCKIYLQDHVRSVNAKSIMGMMSTVLLKGDRITVETDGEDEEAAFKAVQNFLTRN